MLTFEAVQDHRLFVSQETLDIWMTDGRVEVEGEVMTLLPDGQRFKLKTAVHFLEGVAGGGDAAELIGKVKDVETMLEMGAEHVADSVILDESAYQVMEGFLGEPIWDDNAKPPKGAADPEDNVGRLARFFLGQH